MVKGEKVYVSDSQETMSDFNEDELIPPTWMNETFFEEVLRASEDDNTIKVNKLDITPATGKGDHYASIMFRARVTYDSRLSKVKCTSLILKTMPETDCHKNDMFGELPMFEIEIDMYSRLIPKFERELRKIGDNTVLGARMVYHSLKPRKCIIFEDLVERGYTSVRGRFLNLPETKAAFLKLAKWHAVSYKLAAEGDVPVTIPKGGFFDRDNFDSMPMMSSAIANVIKTIEDIDELKLYAEKLKEIPSNFFKRFTSSISSTETQAGPSFVSVLCHGDFHSRNIMFKYANGVLNDAMLLDFQIGFFGPAVIDLLYALYLMVGEEIRMGHREELVYYYASNFIDTLKRMNFQGKCPSISDFYIDILRARHWELMLLAAFLPIVYVVVNRTMEIEEVMQSEEAFRKTYNNPAYVRELKAVLPKLCHIGYFE